MAYFSLVYKPRHFLCAFPWLLPLLEELSFAVGTTIRWHAICDTGSFHSVLRVFIHSPRGLSRIPHWCLTSRFLAWPTMVVCWPTSVNVRTGRGGERGILLYRDWRWTPCLHVNSYRRFEGAYCLRLQGQAVKNECCSFQTWRRLHYYLSKVSNCLSLNMV
jgi:hypothetical protein